MNQGSEAFGVHQELIEKQNRKDSTTVCFRFTFRLLSGIDLSNVSNTDEAKQSAKYDFYRGRSEIDLKSDFSKIWPSLKTKIKIKQDNELVALKLKNIIVEGQQNFDYPRFSTIVFVASVDPYRPFSFQWSKAYGDIVLRGQGSEDGFTQYLQAGIESSDITIGEQPEYKFSKVFFEYIPAIPHIGRLNYL